MVHGIGQRLEKSNLVDDVGNFRHITSSLGERHLTLHQRSTQRVLFIPCQVAKKPFFASWHILYFTFLIPIIMPFPFNFFVFFFLVEEGSEA